MNIFVNYNFENGMPIHYTYNDGVLKFRPQHGYERFSCNSQVFCWNFRIDVAPEAIGKQLKIQIQKCVFKWNNIELNAYSDGHLAAVVSYDKGDSWQALEMKFSDAADCHFEFDVSLNSDVVQIANIVPYNGSNLKKMVERHKNCDCFQVSTLTHSTDNRAVEMLKIGSAKSSIFLRGRVHPCEAGGSWLLEGLIDFLCSGSLEAKKILDRVSFSIVPMMSIDGVYRGMTRFSSRGLDLNRNWGKENNFSKELCPENYALYEWFKSQKAEGNLPILSLCLHNDEIGGLHFSHPENYESYMERMHLFEKLLMKNSWFSEPSKGSHFKNSGTFGEGIMEAFGCDALILELKAHYSESLGHAPLAEDWYDLGRSMALTFYEYIEGIGA